MKKYSIFLIYFMIISIRLYSQINEITVFFEYNSFLLDRFEEKKLEILNTSDKIELIKISGHADSSGTLDYNQLLSEKRIKTVLNYLQSVNYNYSKAKIECYGETYPILDSFGKYLLKMNRCVILGFNNSQIIKKPIHENIDDSVRISIPQLPKKKKKDTVLITQNGVKFEIKECSFSVNIDSIQFDLDGYLTVREISGAGFITIDNEGNCLRSGGIVKIIPKYNGNIIEINKDCPIKVIVPTSDPVDNMRLYKLNEKKLWVEIKG